MLEMLFENEMGAVHYELSTISITILPLVPRLSFYYDRIDQHINRLFR